MNYGGYLFNYLSTFIFSFIVNIVKKPCIGSIPKPVPLVRASKISDAAPF